MGWGTASWEAVAERDPQFIVLLDYQNGQGPEHLRHLQAEAKAIIDDAFDAAGV